MSNTSLPTDYFALFDIAPGFELDSSALESRYFALQRQWHPDRTAHQPPAIRQQAMQMAALINDAHAALSSPLRRAQYLLQREGIRVNTGDDTVKPDNEILMEAMEVQEALRDGETIDIDTRMKACEAELTRAFAASDYPAAAQAALRLQYLSKAAEDARLYHFQQKR